LGSHHGETLDQPTSRHFNGHIDTGFILGSAIYVSNSDIKFTIKDDTRTIVFTFLKEGGRVDPDGRPLPDKMEIKPEPLDKVRTLRFDEAVYFCVITFATIGYGDITPVSQQGRLFITWYALISIFFTLIGIPYLVANWWPEGKHAR